MGLQVGNMFYTDQGYKLFSQFLLTILYTDKETDESWDIFIPTQDQNQPQSL